MLITLSGPHIYLFCSPLLESCGFGQGWYVSCLSFMQHYHTSRLQSHRAACDLQIYHNQTRELINLNLYLLLK